MKIRRFSPFFSGLTAVVFLATVSTPAFAINGGAAVANAAGRTPHTTVGGTVWRAGPIPLVEPCTAILLCKNVILTAAHCLNFNPPGDMYFTLALDMNALPGPGNRYVRTDREYNRNGQTTTVRIDRNSTEYGETYNVPIGPNQSLVVGLALAKFKGDDELAGLTYPNLVPQNFALAQDANALNARHANFLNPGNAATLGRVAGYGDSGANRAGAGAMRKGVMRFLSWVEPTRHAPQGNRRPAANSVNGFLLQFSRGQDNDAHGCPGDSGGSVFFGGDDSDRLGGVLEMISDPACTNPGVPHPTMNGATIPHFNNYVSLIYTKNRELIRDYMNDNCSDDRTIDIKTGDNIEKPKTKEEEELFTHQNVEDWTCTPPPQDISPATYPEDFFAFYEGWAYWMLQIYPGFPVNLLLRSDASSLPAPAPVYCAAVSPTPTETLAPTPLPTPESVPTSTATPNATPIATIPPVTDPTAMPTSSTSTLSDPIPTVKTDALTLAVAPAE